MREHSNISGSSVVNNANSYDFDDVDHVDENLIVIIFYMTILGSGTDFAQMEVDLYDSAVIIKILKYS